MDQMEWRSWAWTATGRLALLLLSVQNHLLLAQVELVTLLPPLAEMPPSLSIAVDLKAMKRNILALKGFFSWNSYLTWGRGTVCLGFREPEILLKLCMNSRLYSYMRLFVEWEDTEPLSSSLRGLTLQNTVRTPGNKHLPGCLSFLQHIATLLL